MLVSFQFAECEAEATQRMVRWAIDRLEGPLDEGKLRLGWAHFMWAWQAAELLEIESGCDAAFRIPQLNEFGEDDWGHASVPLPIWQWKVLWVVLGYGLILSARWDEEVERGERFSVPHLLRYLDPHAQILDGCTRDRTYQQWWYDLDEGLECWERLEEAIRAAVARVTPDPHAGSPWLLHPLPLDPWAADDAPSLARLVRGA